MSDEKSSAQGYTDAIKVALIGAAATVTVALISGVFTIMQREEPAQQPTPRGEAAIVEVLSAPQLVTPTAAVLPPVVITDTGMAFASKISPDGIALDPGMQFPATTKSIYVVFRPGRTPPGLQVSHPAPVAEHYYAYLEAGEKRAPSSVGWRWYYQDEMVNEYETELGDTYLWLMVFSEGERGLFEGILGEAGRYDVHITLAGNPSVHSQLLIKPQMRLSTEQVLQQKARSFR